MLNKFMYWVENNVLRKDAHEFSYWELKIYKELTWLLVLC